MFALNLALLANNIGLLWVAIEMATLATVLIVGSYRVISRLTLGFKLILGPPLLVKSRKTLSIRRLKGLLMTEIQIIGQSFFIVRTLLNRNALRRQSRLVETSQLRGDA